MPEIKLFELGPTRSARCRWTLLEAGLEYQSVGNDPAIIGSDALTKVHPLGKLPAAIIDGRPLFESAAISAAIADLVPEKNLIARPGTWARTVHDQWVLFALTEMEPWVASAELNTLDFVLPKEQHVPAILAQDEMMFKRSAAALDGVLASTPYLVEERFTVADIIVGYTVNFGDWYGWINEFPNLVAYLERLFQREHCTMIRSE
ncbi:MAG: glutathione S-transferase family protein [Chloroflexota bacterium]